MGKHIITESEVERVALDILSELGYEIIYGPDIAPDGLKPERQSYADVILIERLREAINRFNPMVPADAKDEAIKRILRIESPSLVINNQSFHRMLVDGVDVEYRENSGIASSRNFGARNDAKYDKVWLFDFDNIDENEFLAVNQFTVIENNVNRRPDIVLFVNGLPIAVIELKNPADENAMLIQCFLIDTISLSLPMRRTEASMISLMVLPGTCAMLFQMPHLLVLPEHPLRNKTEIP